MVGVTKANFEDVFPENESWSLDWLETVEFNFKFNGDMCFYFIQ
jgi:hypothetical protein